MYYKCIIHCAYTSSITSYLLFLRITILNNLWFIYSTHKINMAHSIVDAEVYGIVSWPKQSTLPYGAIIGQCTAGHWGFYLHGTEILLHPFRDPRHEAELGYQEKLPCDLLHNINSKFSFREIHLVELPWHLLPEDYKHCAAVLGRVGQSSTSFHRPIAPPGDRR